LRAGVLRLARGVELDDLRAVQLVITFIPRSPKTCVSACVTSDRDEHMTLRQFRTLAANSFRHIHRLQIV
jgi:hypothetical protein